MTVRVRSSEFEVSLPSAQEVADAHDRYQLIEGRDVVYRVARSVVEDAYAGRGTFSAAEGVAVLLLSWNAGFYRPRPWLAQSLVDDLDRIVSAHAPAIDRFRVHDIRTFDAEGDSQSIVTLYEAFLDTLWPVGAAKAMHMLAPSFFPLWDDAIARRFHLQLSPPSKSIASYLELISIGQRFGLASNLPNPLKAFDEWAYVTFTVPTRRFQGT
jgi:hypothetical protein